MKMVQSEPVATASTATKNPSYRKLCSYVKYLHRSLRLHSSNLRPNDPATSLNANETLEQPRPFLHHPAAPALRRARLLTQKSPNVDEHRRPPHQALTTLNIVQHHLRPSTPRHLHRHALPAPQFGLVHDHPQSTTGNMQARKARADSPALARPANARFFKLDEQ
ncbi:unnamed protein product [Cyclocybe aegerita]|uniref:Uncharacterized protein n=1 Tax=Cyclocybe aegerita TaxID=1973307 RepID=A0A8S0VZF0_CYCAE|nr:unnamed protein product [Cyclocybe aegerita]